VPENTAKPAGTIEVCGYITDPKRSGFQVLTNYECIYWRALVGNDAWGLYEVLRSFCHDGATACFPSIEYLKDILGFKDKRALIGRRKVVKGKTYEYPGIIDTLQEHGLIVAEVRGDGPKMRYIFHINLTPGQLTDAQVRRLPAQLREKHRSLIERIKGELKSLQSKKKEKRFADDVDTESAASPEAPQINRRTPKKGSGKFPQGEREIPTRGVGNSHPNITKISIPKDQHQQQSKNIKKPPRNPNKDEPPGTDDVVVKLLTSFGVTESSAGYLARNYSKEHIIRQVRNLKHRNDKGEAIKGNQGGKLRSMIENDWPFLNGYKSPEEIAQEEKQRVERLTQAEMESSKQRKNLENRRQERNKLIQQIRTEMGVTDALSDRWERRKKTLKSSLPPQEYMFLVSSYLLGVEGTTAVIGVSSSFNQDRLKSGKLHAKLKDALAEILPDIEEVDVVMLDEMLAKISNGNAQ